MSAGAFDDGGDAVIEMDLLPPRWIDIQDEVTEALRNDSQKIGGLGKAYTRSMSFQVLTMKT